MASASLFASSYDDYLQYPLNHLSSLAYGTSALVAHRNRLYECKSRLFRQTGIHVAIRDISSSGNVNKCNIRSSDELDEFLRHGTTEGVNLSTSTNGLNFSTRDERCRLIFLDAETTIGPLKLNAKMLFRLCSFYQIVPHFLDFLYAYASPHGEDRELHFSGFRTERALVSPVPGTTLPELGRSGRRYQLCYNLKTAALKSGGDWKIRQAAIHHQFDVGQGTQLWVVGDPHAALKERIGEFYHDRNFYPTSFSTLEQAFRSSMDIHLIYFQWATAEWRWNIQFLQEGAEDLTLAAALVSDKSQIESIDPGSLGGAQRWGEKTDDTIMAMESNANIMKLVQRFYRDLVRDADFPEASRRACQQAVKTSSFQLEELICETQMQIARARVLAKTVADRKNILIQHLQAQSALISSKLSASMYEQADQSAMEAIAVRIVTIVTLIYLPATFSSTFFSTQVVNYEGKEVFSQVALERFLQVTLPLMFLTFVPAGCWFWFERRRRLRKSLETKGYFMDFFSQDSGFSKN